MKKILSLIAAISFTSACGLTQIHIHPLATTPKIEKSPLLIPLMPEKSHLFEDYATWLPKHLGVVPNLLEKEILSSYIKYLANPTALNGKSVVYKLKKIASDGKHKSNSRWLQFFDSAQELSNNGYSIGVASGEKFFPLIEKGDKTALEILVIYTASVKSTQANALAMAEYESLARKKHTGLLAQIHVDPALRKFLSEYSANL